MRAAAFLPVVLSLASVVARVRAFMTELDPLLRQAQEAIRLLAKLHVRFNDYTDPTAGLIGIAETSPHRSARAEAEFPEP